MGIELRNKNGSVYIYVIVFLLFSTVILNLGLGIVNIDSEKKYAENNNLYYIAESASNIFLNKLNDILESSLKQAVESEDSEEKIFTANIKKIFPVPNINLQIKNEDENYNVQINFEERSCFDFYVRVFVSNTFNNKYEIDCEYKRAGEKFVVVSYKIG